MSENNYAALMMKRAPTNSESWNNIKDPGIYPIAAGHPSAPGGEAGVLFVTPPKSGATQEFISASKKRSTRTFSNGTWLTWSTGLYVGDLGLSPSLPAQSGVDLDTMNSFGFYVVRDAINAPMGDKSVWLLSVRVWDSKSAGDPFRIVQIAEGYGTSGTLKNRTFHRTYSGNAAGWSEWIEFYSEAHKPTAADTNAVDKKGDRMSGALGSTYSDTYRIVSGKYGTFWRNDGNATYLMLTNADDQWGTYNNFRPFGVNNANGAVTLGTPLTFEHAEYVRKLGINTYQSNGVTYNQTNGLHLQGVGDNYAQIYFLEAVGQSAALRFRVRSGGQDGWPEFRGDGSLLLSGSWPAITISTGTRWHPDGNVEGAQWGGYLSNWLNNQLSARDNNIATRATWEYVNQNFIQNVRYTAETQHGATGIYTYHENTVLTGFNNWDGDYSAEELFWSYIQIYKNGQWLTIGR